MGEAKDEAEDVTLSRFEKRATWSYDDFAEQSSWCGFQSGARQSSVYPSDRTGNLLGVLASPRSINLVLGPLVLILMLSMGGALSWLRMQRPTGF